MNLLVAGSILGITLGLVMILAFIVPALIERRRAEKRDAAHVAADGDDGARFASASLRSRSLSREDIWNRGCRGEALDSAEAEEFEYLARARFHTFQMGVSHAGRNEEKSTLLIKGLAVELANAPGLEKLWQASPASEDTSGQAVNAYLTDLQKTPGE